MQAKRHIAWAVLVTGLVRQVLVPAMMTSTAGAGTSSGSTTTLTVGLRRELDQFAHSVSAMSEGLSSLSTMWSDQQYTTLLALVRSIAGTSKKVIVSGERSCAMLDRFERIAQEDV